MKVNLDREGCRDSVTAGHSESSQQLLDVTVLMNSDLVLVSFDLHAKKE